MDIFILMRKNFGSRHFYYGYYWFNGISWSIEDKLEQWPQLIHQINQKIKVSQAIKEKEAQTIHQVFTDRPYRSQNLAETLDVQTTISDRPLFVHGLSVSWPWTVWPCRTDCPYALCACDQITKDET
jgi:hypothetical protein